MKTVAERIKHLRPCEEAVAWAEGFTSNTNAWQECDRGDWMLWLLGHVSGRPYSSKRKQLVLCACECAALSFKHGKDKRVKKCLEISKLWVEGKVTEQELAAGAAGAAEAYRAAAKASWPDAGAARAAMAAAKASWASSWASSWAAWAAGAAAEAAGAAMAARAAAMAAGAAMAAAMAARAAAMADQKKCLQECANIVRKHYPKPPSCR